MGSFTALDISPPDVRSCTNFISFYRLTQKLYDNNPGGQTITTHHVETFTCVQVTTDLHQQAVSPSTAFGLPSSSGLAFPADLSSPLHPHIQSRGIFPQIRYEQ